jgi:hypothetical protein
MEHAFYSAHMRGWVDAMMRLHPPAICPKDYAEGYKAGLRHRLMDCRASVARLPHIVLKEPCA